MSRRTVQFENLITSLEIEVKDPVSVESVLVSKTIRMANTTGYN